MHSPYKQLVQELLDQNLVLKERPYSGANALRYHASHAQVSVDLEFYRDLFERLRPKRVIELGCGGGRLALPLASLTEEYVAVDNAPGMLRLLLEDARREGISEHRLKASLCDMRDLSEPHPADLIFVPINTIYYMQSEDDRMRLFSSVVRNLKPGGRFVIDWCANPVGAGSQSSLSLNGVRVGDSGPFDLELHHALYNPTTRRRELHTLSIRLTGQGAAEVSAAVEVHHLPSISEVSLLLRHFGFEIEETYGDYRAMPLDSLYKESQCVIVSRLADPAVAPTFRQ